MQVGDQRVDKEEIGGRLAIFATPCPRRPLSHGYLLSVDCSLSTSSL